MQRLSRSLRYNGVVVQRLAPRLRLSLIQSQIQQQLQSQQQEQQQRRWNIGVPVPQVDQDFKPRPPTGLTTDMAEGIVDATHFYIRHGISGQRLKVLADLDLPVVEKWQKMMEIYLTTQVHVTAGLGYPPDDEGLNLYARHLAVCIQTSDSTMKELFTEVRRDTWREVVGTTFHLDAKDIPILSIVDARNLMHKISSKMIEPDLLLQIQQRTAKITGPDPNIVLQEKHKILQDILVTQVYLGGNPSLVEQVGFGTGAQAYAKLQCAMTDHEGDPLMAEYASSAMLKVFRASGIDVNNISGPGLNIST
jgi:hypothetical protein